MMTNGVSLFPLDHPILSRLARIAACVSFGIAGHALSLTSAAAEADPFRDWQVECRDAPFASCILSTTSGAEDAIWLATMRIAPEPGDRAVVQLLLPPGIHRASGAFVEVAGIGREPARPLRCLPQACEAQLALDARAIAAWKAGLTATVTYRPGAEAPPIRFEMSLLGLTAALDHADERQR
jgi:invasion protein IalB